MTVHVVQFSAASAVGPRPSGYRRTRHRHLVLLVADTQIEDPDLWRFVHDSTVHIGVDPTSSLTAVPRSRSSTTNVSSVTVDWRRVRRSSSNVPAGRGCTRADPADTVLYVGSTGRKPVAPLRSRHGWAPWTVRFPMCDPPYLSKEDMLDAARAAGLTPPRLYELGFSHNNCGGVCVGEAKHWLHLLEVFPDRYAQAEARNSSCAPSSATSPSCGNAEAACPGR